MSSGPNPEFPAERELDTVDEQTGTTDAPAEGDDAGMIDSLQDLKADRDEDGNRIPEAIYVEELGGKIEVLQPTQGETEEYIEPYFDGSDVDNEHLAEMFEAFFPAFDTVTAEDINDMTTKRAQGLLVAILKRAERDRAVKLLRGDIDDDLIEEVENSQRLQSAAEGNR